MTDSTLDPLAVLAARTGETYEGAIILADKEWLDKSIFPTIWLHRNFHPEIFAPEYVNKVREADRAARAAFLEFASGKKIAPKTKEDYVSSFYIGEALHHDLDDFHDYRDRPEPVQNFRVWDSFVQLASLYLVDMATDVLAKEKANIPTTDDRGKALTKSDRRYYFRNAICERVPEFLFNEMPETLVNLLGYQFEEVIHHYWEHAITLYQLLHLLAEKKAEVEDETFIYHYDAVSRDPDGPFLFFDDDYSSDSLRFDFPLEDVFGSSDYGRWLERDKDGDLYISGDSGDHDWFYPREMLKRQEAHPDYQSNLFYSHHWQYLSFKKKGFNKATLMQKVVCNGVLSLYQGNFAEVRLARELIDVGLISSDWKGVYYPPISCF